MQLERWFLLFLIIEFGGVVIQQSFKMIIVELVAVFLLINESMVRMLSLFFTMKKLEAGQAVEIYKRFTKQTKKIEEMFELASRNEYLLNIRIPAFDIVTFLLIKSHPYLFRLLLKTT